MRKVGLLLGALLLVPALAIPASGQVAGSFADVPVDHWAYDAVQQLAEAGIVEGYPPDFTFQGQRAMSRYEMAMVVARAGDWVDQQIKDRIAELGVFDATKYYTKTDVDNKIADINRRIEAIEPTGMDMDAIRRELGDALLTPEQRALLNRLQTEFQPELRRINNTLADFEDWRVEVEDWIATRPEPPKITLSGDLRWRFGTYGDDMKLTGDVASYPLSLENWAAELGLLLGDPFMWAYNPGFEHYGEMPFVIAGLKDAYKAPKFDSTRIRLIASGDVNENLSVKLVAFSDPRSNITRPMYLNTEFYDLGMVSPNNWYSDGLMANMRFDEAHATFNTSALVPLTVTAGRQYFKCGMGLLVDNNQASFNAVKATWGEPTGWNLTGIAGLFEREAFDGQGADLLGMMDMGQDGYDAWRLAVPFGGYTTAGLNWLGSGFGTETGWSADIAGRIFGFDYSAEYAKLADNAAGIDIQDDDTAYVASVDLVDSSSVKLNAKYGLVEPCYALCHDSAGILGGGWSRVPMLIETVTGLGFWGSGPLDTGIWNLPFSALHPYASVAADYIDWIDRPLFLNPSNVAKGWEVMVELPNLLGSNSPLTVRYYDGKAYNPGWIHGALGAAKWRDADRVWTVSLTRNIAENVDWTLLYGRRDVDNVLQPDPALSQDPLQVLRTEVMVRF